MSKISYLFSTDRIFVYNLRLRKKHFEVAKKFDLVANGESLASRL